MLSLSRRRRALGALGVAVLALPVSAASLPSGLYDLHNHPDGSVDPPPYGMRLDELFNVTGGHDIFTFDFDHPSSSMTMVLDTVNATILISGVSYGGRDTGTGYANDAHLGVYTLSFLYNINVQPVGGDDDIWVVAPPDEQNFGTITTPSSQVLNLADVADSGYTFRLGDENNDLGHRGYPGISGWGWLNVNGAHVDAQDWLFTATYVPEPATFMLATILLTGLTAQRRRMR